MFQQLFRNNFRAQLIVPVAIAFICIVISAIAFIIVAQKSNRAHLNKQIETTFVETEASIEKNLASLSRQLDSKLQRMQKETSKQLKEASTKALQQTAASVMANMQTMRKQSGNNLLHLMALSAINAVITRDFATLNGFVRSAHKNKDIVFLFYQDSNKKPLTRFLNRKNKKLVSYLPKGRPDITKIIQAGKNDPDVFVLSRNITSDGEIIGSVTLGMDITRAQQQARQMSARFNNLVNNNEKRINTILGKESKAINTELQTVVSKIQKDITKNAEKTVGDITRTSNRLAGRSRNLFIVGSLLGLTLILIILLLNARSILKLLGGEPATMVQLAKRIADGDLSTDEQTIKPTQDSLLASLNEMRDKLRRLVGKIVDEGDNLHSTSTELALAAEDMTNGAEQSATKADAVATATERMSKNMGTVTQASEQAAENVTMVATAIEEMTSAVQKIARNTDKARAMTKEAVEYADNSTEKVNQLGNAADEISKVTEVITEISEQTNLLALNATIEAARAGEAGKGFAVVANEIKELAKQTAEATGEIKHNISSIQSSTEATIAEITEISSVINNVNDLVTTIATAVEEQSVTAGEISNNVNEAANGIGEVNENVVQSSIVAGEIARDIADVSHVSRKAKEGSLRLQVSSRELNTISKNIRKETSQFHLTPEMNGKPV